MDKFREVRLLTTGLEKCRVKLRVRWMRVNKNLSVYYKTGRLIKRLRKLHN